MIYSLGASLVFAVNCQADVLVHSQVFEVGVIYRGGLSAYTGGTEGMATNSTNGMCYATIGVYIMS